MFKLTRNQMERLKEIYFRDKDRTDQIDGLPFCQKQSYLAFRRTIQIGVFGDFILVPAYGMVLGIDKDGIREPNNV